MPRGRSGESPISSRRLEQILSRARGDAEEGAAILDYVRLRLMPARPEGIELPDEWVDEFPRSSGQLALLMDKLAIRPPDGWLAFVREFEARAREG
jgi:hypothetical protein